MNEVLTELYSLITVLTNFNNGIHGPLSDDDYQKLKKARSVYNLNRPITSAKSFTFPGCPHDKCEEMPKCLTICRQS